MDNKIVEIEFGGKLHEIDIELLIECLVNYSSVTQETAAYLSPGIKVDIKIQAPRQGSFIVLLDLIAQNSGDLFTSENIALSANIVSIVGSLYVFKQWIAKNGRPEVVKPINDNSIEISNKNGNITINMPVYNIYQENSKVRENLRNTFAKLKEREEIQDFSMKDVDAGEYIFKAERADFSALASGDDEVEQRKQKIIRERQELFVFKIVFKESYKWEFFYQGTKIYAAVKDQEFFQKIEKGEVAFRSGDKLVADIVIDQVFNEAANTFVNESYSIAKVVEHIPRVSSAQHSFSFNQTDV